MMEFIPVAVSQKMTTKNLLTMTDITKISCNLDVGVATTHINAPGRSSRAFITVSNINVPTHQEHDRVREVRSLCHLVDTYNYAEMCLTHIASYQNRYYSIWKEYTILLEDQFSR